MAYSDATKKRLFPATRQYDLAIPEGGEISQQDGHLPSAFSAPGVGVNPLDVHGLVLDLIGKYNQNNDVGVIRGWFRRKCNLEPTEKHLQSLGSLVAEVRNHAANLTEFRAQLISQQQVMEARVIELTEAAWFVVEKQRSDHQRYLQQQEYERQRAEIELDRGKLENIMAGVQIEKMRAEVSQEKQKVILLGQKSVLIEKITSELDFKNLNMKQVFVLIEMVKDSRSNADILTAEAEWERMKAEARQAEAQADQEQHKAKYANWKMEQEMKTPNE
jgi:hypothetical protein